MLSAFRSRLALDDGFDLVEGFHRLVSVGLSSRTKRPEGFEVPARTPTRAATRAAA